MKIVSARSWVEEIDLTRPYSISFKHTSAVSLVFVRLESDGGAVGLGAATPVHQITGETLEGCRAALEEEALAWLVGRELETLPALCRENSRRTRGAPAARAAIDMAFHDLLGQRLGVAVVDMLGRAHDALPTSITIGIKATDEAVAEGEEYVGRGFRILKVKLGKSVEEDIERVRRLREALGASVMLRVDPNQGYSYEDLMVFVEATRAVDIEFIEQPMRADDVEALERLPGEVRDKIAADETLQSEEDALALAAPPRSCGIFNIKLMKCGGIHAAQRIATMGEVGGVHLMWGCMDESRISIAAALHAALASPATRYLDLDGHLDLARDVAEGGFILEDGMMRTMDRPGLGLRAVHD